MIEIDDEDDGEHADQTGDTGDSVDEMDEDETDGANGNDDDESIEEEESEIDNNDIDDIDGEDPEKEEALTVESLGKVNGIGSGDIFNTRTLMGSPGKFFFSPSIIAARKIILKKFVVTSNSASILNVYFVGLSRGLASLTKHRRPRYSPNASFRRKARPLQTKRSIPTSCRRVFFDQELSAACLGRDQRCFAPEYASES